MTKTKLQAIIGNIALYGFALGAGLVILGGSLRVVVVGAIIMAPVGLAYSIYAFATRKPSAFQRGDASSK